MDPNCFRSAFRSFAPLIGTVVDGGRLPSIAVAAIAHDGVRRLKWLTFAATQLEFTESGELRLSIAEGQIAFREDPILDPGYVDCWQTAGVFRQWEFRVVVTAALRP